MGARWAACWARRIETLSITLYPDACWARPHENPFEIPISWCTQGERAEMVIDGRTLGRVLGSPGEEALAELASLCGGVVVCRASPAQKAAIVRMMARHKQQRLHVRRALKPGVGCIVHAIVRMMARHEQQGFRRVTD